METIELQWTITQSNARRIAQEAARQYPEKAKEFTDAAEALCRKQVPIDEKEFAMRQSELSRLHQDILMYGDLCGRPFI